MDIRPLDRDLACMNNKFDSQLTVWISTYYYNSSRDVQIDIINKEVVAEN